MATVHCPHCQTSLELFRSASGRVVVCPECNTQFDAQEVARPCRFPDWCWCVEQYRILFADIKAKKLTLRVLVFAALFFMPAIGLIVDPTALDSSPRTESVRDVAVDPHAYAGMTLRSRAKMLGDGAFTSLGQRGSLLLHLHVPDSLTEKAERARLATTGQYDYVIIEYEIWPTARLDDPEETTAGVLLSVDLP